MKLLCAPLCSSDVAIFDHVIVGVLNITLEEAEQNGKIRVLSTSARDVVEEYLTVNQHLSREVEGRLVVED